MKSKTNFIKRERVDSDEIPTIKDTYDRISEKGFPNKTLRKNEPFVLMFRDFIFFDVKSYECRKGDLYIRNIVDGIVLKRYFRMDSDDQLTVFKNREEFDIFMKKQKELEYFKGDGVGVEYIVDGVVLNRYIRMDSDDQLTVFKNHEELNIFMKKQKELEYFKGDGVGVADIVNTWKICDGKFSCRAIKSKVTGQYVLEDSEPMLVRKVSEVYDCVQGNDK